MWVIWFYETYYVLFPVFVFVLRHTMIKFYIEYKIYLLVFIMIYYGIITNGICIILQHGLSLLNLLTKVLYMIQWVDY